MARTKVKSDYKSSLNVEFAPPKSLESQDLQRHTNTHSKEEIKRALEGEKERERESHLVGG